MERWDETTGPTRREPILNLPGAVALTLVGLIAIHAARDFLLDPESDIAILIGYGFVPLRFSLGLLAGDAGALPTLVTYGFLHGSWTHVLVNVAWLAAFATPLARRIGAGRMLALLVLATIAGALTHWGVHPRDLAPVIGASAAASGAMAAMCRFGMRVDGRRLGPVEALVDRRIGLFVLIWMVMNLAFGLLAGPLGLVPGGIAWEAHIGGFVAGYLAVGLLDRG